MGKEKEKIGKYRREKRGRSQKIERNKGGGEISRKGEEKEKGEREGERERKKRAK